MTTVTLGLGATTVSWTPDVEFDPSFAPIYFVEFKPVSSVASETPVSDPLVDSL